MNFKFRFFAFSFLLSTGLVAQQNLGVNQANPQAKVHVTQEGSQAVLIVEDQASDPTAFTVDADGNVGVKNNTPTVSLDINGTDAIGIPNGTTAQRPGTPNVGDVRFNIELNNMEYYNGTEWVSPDPAGTINAFGGAIAPSGWLICDGAEVSRTTYTSLFSVIGTSYGAGDGVNTFHLPDLRGRFLRGVDNGTGNDPDAATRSAANPGGNTGDAIGSYQNDEFKSHNHGVTYSHGSTGGAVGAIDFETRSATANQNTSTVGGSETRPKNVNVNYIIKY